MTKRFFFPPIDFGPNRFFAEAGTVTTGTVNSGTYQSTHIRDGTDWEINEVVGAPGFLLTMDFTALKVANKVTIVGFYDGNVGHTVDVDAYNWGTTSYDTLGQLPDALADTVYTFTLSAAHTDSDGSIKIRINHSSPGNVAHILYLDKVHIS